MRIIGRKKRTKAESVRYSLRAFDLLEEDGGFLERGNKEEISKSSASEGALPDELRKAKKRRMFTD